MKKSKIKILATYTLAKANAAIRKKVEAEKRHEKQVDAWLALLTKQVGKHGGQCKAFVWNMFLKHTGKKLPHNDRKLEYQWKSDRPYLTKLFTRKNMAPGDIVQLKYKNIKPSLHTLVVYKVTNNVITVIDSNKNLDEVVHIRQTDDHYWSLVKRFTIYRVDWDMLTDSK